ncbi:hypothetical protein NQ315_015191 [Exocentrus adspersus]|uniref:WASH complex subunit 3 n=1 Tax=Exocentrus adspersus TaxID=1586481 RepID=A0AAV8VIB7_9CUCU|nr:hypothetical protein NQ315_015191 [Exocentrus adspersus]
MQEEEFPRVDTNVDLTQILPIQQKRTIAFVNHFIMQTVSFLNKFAQSCESRFMEFEYKIQKIEASLLILESQLSSISGLENPEKNTSNNETNDIPTNVSKLDLPDIEPPSGENVATENQEAASNTKEVGVKACEDHRFKNFFKMLQFGVPEPAVKLKMRNEGLDPSILDKPNDIILDTTQDSSQHSMAHN